MEAAQRPRHAASARLRGPGPGTLERPPGAIPPAVRRGQYVRLQPDHAREITSTRCAARSSTPSRKPLIIMSPKSLLRHKLATSELDELSSGGFQRVIPDRETRSTPPTSTACCSAAARSTTTSTSIAKSKRRMTALVRVEQLYPLDTGKSSRGRRPVPECRKQRAGFRKSRRIWEHGRYLPATSRDLRLRPPCRVFVGRRERESPATGHREPRLWSSPCSSPGLRSRSVRRVQADRLALTPGHSATSPLADMRRRRLPSQVNRPAVEHLHNSDLMTPRAARRISV